MKPPTPLACVAALALLCDACIGRPVVGYEDPGEPDSTGLCAQDTLSCDVGEPAGYPDVDAVRFVGNGRCSDEVLEMSITETGTVDGLDLRCRTLRLTVAHGVEATLGRARIDDAHIVLVSDGIARVNLLAPTGDGASIAVEGMSELWLLSLSEVSNLHVDATSATLGWDVVLANSFVDGIAVRTGPDAQLALRESQVRRGTFEAGQLQLRAVTVEDSLLDATAIDSAGSDVGDSTLRVRRGSFVSGSLKRARWDGCESVLISEALLDDTDIGPCSAAPLELRASDVSDSTVRGHVFALQTGVRSSVVGAHDGASVSLFDARVVASLLCAVDALAARGGTVMTCARCAPHSPTAACIDSSSAVSVVACPTLVDTPTCSEDLPQELRQGSGVEPTEL